MDLLRMYLGDLTGLFVGFVILFAMAAVTSHFLPKQKIVRQVRNWTLAGVALIFLIGLIPSLVVNKTPRGKVDRTGVDQDQRLFEQRHSGEKK